MAYATYQTIPQADEANFFKALTPDSQFLYSKFKRKTGLFSRRKKAMMSVRSLLPQIAPVWQALTPTEQLAWKTAGAVTGLNGWRAFVLEQSQRLKNNLTIPNTPSNFHLGKVGHLVISAPAIQLELAQEHPSSYYIRHRVSGKKGLYMPQEITEIMSLPLQIGLCYKAVLAPTGPTQYAKFYARVRSSYQGVDRFTDLEINLTPTTDWTSAVVSLTSVLGYVIGYTLYFHIYGYTGDLYIDNLKSIHSSTNYARDKACSNIRASFSNQYYQIPKHWVALAIPVGASYNSEYIDF